MEATGASATVAITITWAAQISYTCDVFYDLELYSSQDNGSCNRTASDIVGTSYTFGIPQPCDVYLYETASILAKDAEGRSDAPPVEIPLEGNH